MCFYEISQLHRNKFYQGKNLLKYENITIYLKITDSSYWGVHPYCTAWGNSTVFGDKTGKLSFGVFQSGSGMGGEPMVFTGGSDENCGAARSAELFYECYCDEYSCATEPAWNKTTL